MRNSARFRASEARPARLLPRRRHRRVWRNDQPKLLRFCARKGVTSWRWPCGHQPRPLESKGSRGASNAPRQQTQRRTGFLRGQSSFESGLRSERYGSRPREGARELRPDGEVGVKLDALKATDAEWQPAPLVLGEPNSRSTAARLAHDTPEALLGFGEAGGGPPQALRITLRCRSWEPSDQLAATAIAIASGTRSHARVRAIRRNREGSNHYE